MPLATSKCAHQIIIPSSATASQLQNLGLLYLFLFRLQALSPFRQPTSEELVHTIVLDGSLNEYLRLTLVRELLLASKFE